MRGKCSFALTFLAASLLAFSAKAAPVSPLTYDCQARITSTEIVPPPDAAAADTWQCKSPDAARKESSALHWFRDSLEYCRITTTIYAQALRAARAAAAKYGRGHWIVFMDADETVLDNSLYQRERDACALGYSDASWEQWAKLGVAREIPGAAAFTQNVHALGGLVAIVTNRDSGGDALTRDNLKKLQIWFDYEIGVAKGAPTEKSARWRAAEAALSARGRHARGALWIGDQVSDLPVLDGKGEIVRPMGQADAGDGIGVRYFVVPNPIYGGWLANARH